MTVAKVQRWGNSQGLRLSKQILEQADIEIGDAVEVIVGEHEIVLKKSSKRPKYDIRELVSQIPRGYESGEETFGPPVGKEEW